MAHAGTVQNRISSVCSPIFAHFIKSILCSRNKGSLKSEEQLSDLKERCAQLWLYSISFDGFSVHSIQLYISLDKTQTAINTGDQTIQGEARHVSLWQVCPGTHSSTYMHSANRCSDSMYILVVFGTAYIGFGITLTFYSLFTHFLFILGDTKRKFYHIHILVRKIKKQHQCY